MKIKYNSEIIAGSIFTIVSSILWVLIPSQIQTLETSSVNAQTVPRIAISGLFLFSVALFIQGIAFVPKKEFVLSSDTIKDKSFIILLKPILYAAILLVYAVLLTFLGFIISTLALVVLILVFYGSKKWHYYAIACSTVFIVYYVFATVLSISLP